MPRAEDTADERPPGRAGLQSERPTAVEQDSPLPTATDQARIGYIGKRLGRFLITAELGRGGMATVYRARDPQVGRDVAVKVMHGFFAGRAEIEARFKREATAVAAIRHPSILALYDFAPPIGEEPGYIVSELIEGPGLRQLLEDCGGRLAPEVAALITIRVAEALGVAHAAGIVHRDVKPDNVLIDRSGGGARVVLTDFGVAHVAGMDTMTATGAVLGSPAYMSPEQARGEDVGPPSDVFALGVVMYQLCTGHLPFAGKDPLTVITAILRGEYVRPAKLEARIGPDWEAVMTRCLARDPVQRFPDGGAVAEALRALLATAGFLDEQGALRSYLASPEAFERDNTPRIVRQAVASAELARRRRQIPRALAEVGRALAYASGDPIARALLERLGARRRSLWMRAAVVGVGAAAVATVAVWFGARSLPTPIQAAGARRTATAIVPARPPRTDDRSATDATTVKTAAAATAPPAPPAPPAPLAARPATTRRHRDTGARPRPRFLPVETEMASSAAPGLAGSRSIATVGNGMSVPGATDADQMAPVTGSKAGNATTAPDDRGNTGSVVLRASHGFCEPSLDGHQPSLRASYNELAAGNHEIYCTLPQGGGKVRVATYELRPGTHPSLIIVPGPNGRPILGRPE